MLSPPYEILACSWPRPVEQRDGAWASPPEWGAPPMPYRPQPYWEQLGDELCYLIDWREFFRAGLKVWDRGLCGEMRDFHLVFRLRVARDGALVFWDDDGSIVRRDGAVLHHDPSAHMLARHELPVRAGDELEVAQWQSYGGWLWGADIHGPGSPAPDAAELLRAYLPAVTARLAAPSGPPLKLYAGGAAPLRAALAVYSMVLRGYSPAEVLLYGEGQWPEPSRALLARLLPFARVVPDGEALEHALAAGGHALADLARRHWFVMKACVALLCPPAEFCLMDDDVFILDAVDDALAAFAGHDLVYAPDTDHDERYRATWGWLGGRAQPLTTGRLNAGLYWMRVRDDPRWLAACALRVPPRRTPAFVWEQGLLAALYARRPSWQLPATRYFYPLFDGLPGGMLGYDYAANPCGFASVHFGGLTAKPAEAAVARLAPLVLAPATPAPPR